MRSSCGDAVRQLAASRPQAMAAPSQAATVVQTSACANATLYTTGRPQRLQVGLESAAAAKSPSVTRSMVQASKSSEEHSNLEEPGIASASHMPAQFQAGVRCTPLGHTSSPLTSQIPHLCSVVVRLIRIPCTIVRRGRLATLLCTLRHALLAFTVMHALPECSDMKGQNAVLECNAS